MSRVNTETSVPPVLLRGSVIRSSFKRLLVCLFACVPKPPRVPAPEQWTADRPRTRAAAAC